MKLLYSILGLASANEFRSIIDKVNSKNVGWVAGDNWNEGTTLDDIRVRCGALENKGARPSYPNYGRLTDDPIPDTFDARTNWKSCTVIADIRDQGACGSCWAFGAAETISDRICITSKGKTNVMYSAEDIMTCCPFCGNGCNGGQPLMAMEYWATMGVVTGGLYGTTNTCQPYTMKPCEHHTTGDRPPCTGDGPTPKCQHRCIKEYTGNHYKADKSHGEKAYMVPADVPTIQKEIMTFGPVSVAFTVYSDFPTYKTGVYKHTDGKELGGHAVKMIGWGTENGTDYWLINNSWNSDWGDKGTFKIVRGTNECGIESQVVAAHVAKTPPPQ